MNLHAKTEELVSKKWIGKHKTIGAKYYTIKREAEYLFSPHIYYI
jgi:hypothetical protein